MAADHESFGKLVKEMKNEPKGKEGKRMRTARLGFILSMLALLCFLFACAETAPTVKPTPRPGRKRPSV